MTSDDDQFDDGLEEFDDAAADDFSGDDAQTEESFADEDWDSYDEQGDAQQDDAAPQKAKKKSNTFNLAIIGLGVLAGASLLVLKLGGGSAPAPTPITAPETIAEAPAPPPAPAGTPIAPAETPTAPTEEGFLTSPENMAELEQDIAATYSNTEVIGVVESAPEEVDGAATPPMPAPMEQTETESPLSSMAPPPGLDNLTATQPAETTTTTTPGTVNPAATEAAPIRMPSATDVLLKQPAEDPTATPAMETTATPEQGAEMLAKLDQVLTRLDQLESDVSALKEQNQASSESLEALEDKISERPAAAAPAPRPAAEDFIRPPQPQILGSGTSEAKPASKPVSSPQKQVTQWVLKGAQPGRAMVSQPGDTEMRNVEVGDTLPGIGRITSISYQDGRWVVQGTQGKIGQ